MPKDQLLITFMNTGNKNKPVGALTFTPNQTFSGLGVTQEEAAENLKGTLPGTLKKKFDIVIDVRSGQK
jgi:hypothetical protein